MKHSKIKDQVRTKTKYSNDYDEKYIKIEVNSYNGLILNKTL